MGNLREEFEAQAQNRGSYEKQVKVRGHHRPLTNHTGRQSRPGLQQVFGFGDVGSYGESV